MNNWNFKKLKTKNTGNVDSENNIASIKDIFEGLLLVMNELKLSEEERKEILKEACELYLNIPKLLAHFE